MKMERRTEDELIALGRRDWYKRMNEALMKEIQKAREKSNDLARYGV